MPHKESISRLLSSFVVAVAATLAMPVVAQTSQPRPSESDCSARADRAARDSTGVAGGAVRGTVGGAAFGAIVGGGKGARRGAVTGAVVGGAVGGVNRNETYKRVYDECMRGR